MNTRGEFDRLPTFAGVGVMVLAIAACTIKLRDDEDQTSSASSASPDAEPLAAELARCRSVTPEQKDALEACRRVWAEQRRRFLGQSKTPSPTSHPDDSAPNIGFPAPGPRKDKSRLPQGWPQSLLPKASERWVAPASSIIFSGFSPNISTADSGCCRARWPLSPPR
ncbi:MAG: putative entry exclusion protein TrbK-alt [Bradyrhizobium sp.]